MNIYLLLAVLAAGLAIEILRSIKNRPLTEIQRNTLREIRRVNPTSLNLLLAGIIGGTSYIFGQILTIPASSMFFLYLMCLMSYRLGQASEKLISHKTQLPESTIRSEQIYSLASLLFLAIFLGVLLSGAHNK